MPVSGTKTTVYGALAEKKIIAYYKHLAVTYGRSHMPFPHFLQRLFGRSTSAPEPESVIPDDLLAADMARYDVLTDLGYFDDENDLTTEQREALFEALDEKFEELRDLPEFKNATAAQLYIAAGLAVNLSRRSIIEKSTDGEPDGRNTHNQIGATIHQGRDLGLSVSENSSILRSVQVTPENTDAYWVMKFSKSRARGR